LDKFLKDLKKARSAHPLLWICSGFSTAEQAIRRLCLVLKTTKGLQEAGVDPAVLCNPNRQARQTGFDQAALRFVSAERRS